MTYAQIRSVPRAAVVAAAALCASVDLGSAQAAPDDAVSRIQALALTPIEAGQAAGMSIAVVRGSDTVLVEGFGSADLELGVPTPSAAVYEIGSVTKQFTAAALFLLQEDAKLSLDDPLSKWMPDYPLGGREISVRRLMDHTSGIKGYTEMPAFRHLAVSDLPRDTLVALFAAAPFEFEPGEALIYNNSAYFLLGLIIEKASGGSYEDFVESRVFGPAGMTNSRYCHKDELTPNRARGYQPTADGLRPADYLNHLWPYAAGSLCSTVRDLTAWNQALHGDGEGGGLLSPESYRDMIRPEPLVDGTPLRYAKGLAITERGGSPRISHGGGIFGFVSELRYLPEHDLSIAVLVNTAGAASPSRIADGIEDVLLGPEPARIPRAFSGDLEVYAGQYHGPGRGRRLNATVSVSEDGGLEIRLPPAPTAEVEWLGGHTFAVGNTRYAFKRPRAGGGFDELHMDHVTGHYVLRRTSP